MKRILPFIMFFLLITSAAWAGDEKKPLSRADFAYGMALSISGNVPIYSVELPSQVYQGCTRSDLGDLRIFNSRNIVPHLLRPQVSKKKSRPPVTPPFFPLLGETGMDTAPGLHIATNNKGTIININQEKTVGASSAINSYVIDISQIKQKPDWLEFDWSNNNDHFSTSVRLQTSDNLNNWHSLVRSASLAELNFGGHNLLRNRIDLPRGALKYLRLSWPAGKKEVSLTVVKAGYNEEKRTGLRRTNRLVADQKIEDSAPAEPGKKVYYYISDGFFPVDQLYVRLPQPNSLAQVIISSRVDKDATWQHRMSLLSYQLTVDGVALESETSKIRQVTDRFWRIEMQDTGDQSGAPTLELGWLPGQLVFMAQGEKPFTLAYGRSGLKEMGFQVDQLLQDIDLQENNLIKPARVGQQVIIGGKGLLLPSPPGIPWRRWLLWGGLFGGVLLIGGMAWQLFKEMKKETNLHQ